MKTRLDDAVCADLELLDQHISTKNLDIPYLARWAESGSIVPYSSTDMKNDDTGTWRKDADDADT